MKTDLNIARPHYLKELLKWKDDAAIKVVIGPRRSGKSMLFSLYQDELRRRGVTDDHIIAFNLEDLRCAELTDAKTLYDTVMNLAKDDDTYYVFLDEIQECRQFEKAVNSLALQKNIDICITGSNAHILSGELTTFLSGRFIRIEMMPLSFTEFRSAVKEDGLTPAEDFNRYLTIGTYPALVAYRNDPVKITTYYSSLIDTVIEKDIRSRYQIRNAFLLRRVIQTIASSVGSPVSARKITNTLKSNHDEVSNVTVNLYLKALEEAYVCYRVPRYDVKGNKCLTTDEKFYLCDPGFRQNLINAATPDLGRLIENIVYLELRRRFIQVTVGKVGKQEVDFVARTRDDVRYYQVSVSVLNEDTFLREIHAFDEIRDNYPKILLTLDVIGNGRNINGIRQINLIDWLLSSETVREIPVEAVNN